MQSGTERLSENEMRLRDREMKSKERQGEEAGKVRDLERYAARGGGNLIIQERLRQQS